MAGVGPSRQLATFLTPATWVPNTASTLRRQKSRAQEVTRDKRGEGWEREREQLRKIESARGCLRRSQQRLKEPPPGPAGPPIPLLQELWSLLGKSSPLHNPRGGLQGPEWAAIRTGGVTEACLGLTVTLASCASRGPPGKEVVSIATRPPPLNAHLELCVEPIPLRVSSLASGWRSQESGKGSKAQTGGQRQGLA